MAIEISKVNMYLFAVLLTVLATGHFAYSESDDYNLSNQCNSKTTCHDCIQSSECAWCMAPDYGDKPRCFLPSTTHSSCAAEYTWDPSTGQTNIINEVLTRAGSASASGHGQIGAGGFGAASNTKTSSSKYGYSEESYRHQTKSQSSYDSRQSSSSSSFSERRKIVQIAPQKVKIKLRINTEHNLNFQYSRAEDYPVDLYYLMDLSKSMEDDKEKLSKLGDMLSDKMRNLTSNFRLGFGSFVDKVLMPYVSTVPKKLEHPCDKCEAPYGYRNHMSLSPDTSDFSIRVREAAVSGNLDAPEGGFDAIMQAIVCRSQIGWREQARRLLVFSTDAGFHYAGDGKLGGVITPNDGECHLNPSGEYTHSTVLDYPSIAQINRKVKENSINVIFAVTEGQQDVYEKLTEHIEGSSSANLKEDSSNVVLLIEEQYKKISSSIQMKHTATGDVSVVFHSSCLYDGKPEETSVCNGLKGDDVVTFTATIKVSKCPPNRKDWNQVFQIYPVGINESLTVDLDILCDCDCEKQGHELFKYRSDKCKGHGTFACGICECDESHFGRNCECSMADIHGESEQDRSCRPDNTTTTECSGNGHCVCGQCECDRRKNPEEIISGKYCECDNFSCERDQGLLCGGPDHGTCVCGHCVCAKGWKNSDCTCLESTSTCRKSESDDICSGQGECVCGACKCKETADGRYSGRFCEKCPTCSGRCQEFKDCVQCQMKWKTGKFGESEEQCASNCTLFVPTSNETVTANEENGDHKCIFYDENDCKFEFVYNDNDIDKIKVTAKEKLECPTQVFILGIVMGVIASIVLIGLALLFLWKILTTIHDRREFAKFEKERMSAKWNTGENPLYKQATSTFRNPTYNGGR